MSDIDDTFPQDEEADVFDQGEENEGEENGNAPERRREYDEQEEEEEEDGEDDEEDDEDEEEDVGAERGKKRAKRRHKPAANRFLDIEAEVDDDEDLDDDDEDYERDEFIADAGAEGDEDINRRVADHARLDRRERELDDRDLARIAQDLNKRYARTAVRYTGDMNEVPQRLLMPDVNDAGLWQVKVKPGRERDIVFSLMRKAIDLESSNRSLQILSAFQRDSLPGIVYVEARSSQQVSRACNGLVGVYPSRGVILVPIEEMASLLQIKKQDLTVTPGSWVRIRRGKYQGDLAQVMDITENGEDVGLKFIPRIDLNPKDETPSALGGKRKKATGNTSATMRPPQRFFNIEEVRKVYGHKQVTKRNQVFVFQNDTYKDGFIEKDFKLSALVLENVNPTLDEITRFTRGVDGTEHENNVDLSIIAEASRKAAISVLQPGDHVEVFEGEQSGVHGVVQTINQDIVTITAIGVDLDGQRVDVPARSVRKRFKPGDHVKVMAGQNADETGLVVSVADNVVTFLSDMSMQEVSVFSKDLREAAEVGSSTNIVGNYELHDLVQLDLQTVGVIFKTERDSFRVLDQNGQVRLVQPHQISMRRDSDRAIATDSEGHELRINDNMKEIDGEGRKGRVLHIHQSFFAFLHNRDIVENGGIFVTRARSLVSIAPKGNLVKAAGIDLSKMNPALSGGATGGMVGSGAMGRGPRDRVIGLHVVVVKGPHKGYVGYIKDTNGPIARVELHTGNKVITIEKEKLKRKLPNGKLEPLEGGNFNRNHSNMGPPNSFGNAIRTPNPYAQSGGRTPGWGGNSQTPAWGANSRTPNPYSSGDGKTPAWNVSSRTPNPYAPDGGKTPAWNASSRTPNPYAQDGGRTPAWNAAARTPNPYGSNSGSGGFGGATPRNSGWGGASPKPSNAWGSESNWGSSSAAGDAWSTQSTWSAATPAAAETPAMSGPTPGATVGYTAATPAGVFYNSLSTSAPTPAFSQLQPTDSSSSDNYEPSTKWLFNLPNRQNVVVRVSGSRGDQGVAAWNNGQREGEEGYLDSMFDTLDAFDCTARIVFFKDKEGMNVPIYCLVPVPPVQRDDALVFDGERKGQILKVRDEGNRGSLVVTAPESAAVFEFPAHLLVKIHPIQT